ncbi:MAG TPA: extracellular solute-binding protein [Thermodesulfobacteriota bacterium]
MRYVAWLIVATLLAGLAPSPAPIAGAAPKEVVFMSWAADYEKKIPALIGPGFEKETGYKLVYVAATNSAEIVARVKAQASDPQIDVIFSDEGPQLLARELWQPIDAKYLTNMNQMYDLARVDGNRRVRPFGSAVVILYNTAVFREKGWAAPTSWNDLWDPKYKGHVILPEGTSPYAYGLTVVAAELHGGSESNLGPGWERMKQLAPSVRLFTTGSARLGDLFRQGTAWLAVHSEGAAMRLRNAGLPVGTAYPREGAIFAPASVAVVKGGPNPDGAQQLVNYLMKPEVQRVWSENFGWAPLNRNTVLPAELAAQLSYGPERVASLKALDGERYSEFLSEFIERWNRDVLSQ